MKIKGLILCAAAMMAAAALSANLSAKDYTLSSPNGALTAKISVEQEIQWSLEIGGEQLIAPSAISMTLSDGTVYGAGKCSVQSAQAQDHNTLTLKFKSYNLTFKAYNEGVAYRFESKAKGAFEVAAEQAQFVLPEDWKLWVPYVQHYETFERQFECSFENQYEYIPVSEWNSARYAFLPLLVDAPNGVKMLITETDLMNYPGMYLHNSDGSTALKGVYAKYPSELKQGGHNNLQMRVKARENYIAKYDNATTFPWRIVAVSTEDSQLLANRLTSKLATPCTGDYSWVKPGKVAWDWWNDWNIKGVDYKSGINNETYKYYIDFAAAKGIEYVILDEGWSVNKAADLFQVVPEIDLEALVEYATDKGVGLILWAGYWAFDRDLEQVCKHYSEMGINGFKVDFMDRDDQIMVDFHRRAAELAAKYHLMLDFHGTYKPSGLETTYPNIVNYEGVFGLEQMKWEPTTRDQVTYDVTIPYIRMVAGPLDYTQGAMRNATRTNYYPVYNEPMSQGTRCRQLAEYIVFNSPLTMLCDSPSAYLAEPESIDFIAAIPTVWDEIVPLKGAVGEYVAIAKRSGETWYVGAMTDWSERDMDLDISFIGGSWKAEIFQDGVNAYRIASDYKHVETTINAAEILKIHLAPGGGYVIKLTK